MALRCRHACPLAKAAANGAAIALAKQHFRIGSIAPLRPRPMAAMV
jgi:hypothetical protein